MTLVTLEEWEKFLKRHPNAHLLQLGAWGELKASFGWDVVRLMVDEYMGAQILFRRLPLGLTLGYLPKPVFRFHDSMNNNAFWNQVDQLCLMKRAVFLKVEPDLWEQDTFEGGHRFSLSPHHIQPPRTILLDIRPDDREILARMKQKCRYNIRLAMKKGVEVRPWTDIDGFHAMLRITGGRDQFGVHARDYYQRAYELFHSQGICELLVAEFEGTPLAALMVFAKGDRAWYVYGASNDLERNRMPTYLLQWEAIRWAKTRGCVEYDLWGVPDEDEDELEAGFETRSDGLWGVYRFKRGFGGMLKRAAPAIDRIYNPLIYKFYLWRVAGREGV